MAKILRAVFAACAFSVVASEASAAPITLIFNLEVTVVGGLILMPQFAGIGVGHVFSGSLTYDPTAVVTKDFGSGEDDTLYFFSNDGTNAFEIVLNGYTFSGPLGQGRVWNDVPSAPHDLMTMSSNRALSVSNFGATSVLMNMVVGSSDSSFFQSSALPSGALDAGLMDPADYRYFTLDWRFEGQDIGFGAEFTNDSPIAVPEPTSFPLLGTGLLGLACGAHRRRVSRPMTAGTVRTPSCQVQALTPPGPSAP